MMIWYSCKVKSGQQMDDGMMKQVVNAYLVDAVSYTDAESRIYNIMERDIAGEFAVTQIAKTNIGEVIDNEESEDWYKAKITYSTVDGDTDKEVTVNQYILVCADNVKQAFERLEEHFNSMLVPFEIPAISLTKFLDVYPFIKDEIPANLTPVSELEASAESE